VLYIWLSLVQNISKYRIYFCDSIVTFNFEVQQDK